MNLEFEVIQPTEDPEHERSRKGHVQVSGDEEVVKSCLSKIKELEEENMVIR